MCIEVVKTAGGTITRTQAANTWDQTVLPFGKKLGLLTGYVKPQAGSSKRTASGKLELQQLWHNVVTDHHDRIEKKALEVLQDRRLVRLILP